MSNPAPAVRVTFPDKSVVSWNAGEFSGDEQGVAMATIACEAGYCKVDNGMVAVANNSTPSGALIAIIRGKDYSSVDIELADEGSKNSRYYAPTAGSWH